MRINTNVSALNAYGNLGKVQGSVSESMAKLSSGFRINKAADDAAGLGISNKLRADIRSMTQASRNAEQANSVLQIAEGASSTIQKMLERMKELATQANSDSVDSDARGRIDKEFQALKGEITRTVQTTKFQGRALLDGGFGGKVTGGTYSNTGTGLQTASLNGARAATYTLRNNATDGNSVVLSATIDGAVVTETATATADGKQTLTFAKLGVSIETTADFTRSNGTDTAGSADAATVIVGATATADFMVSSSASGANDKVTLNAIDLTTAASGLNIQGNDLTTATNAQTALGALDTAIGHVSTKLGEIGAAQNRIGYALENVKTSIQNYTAAESVIRDVDMAEEMVKFSKNNILAQAGTAMLAQANQAGQGVLQLLRG